jgi:hypothetical protein
MVPGAHEMKHPVYVFRPLTEQEQAELVAIALGGKAPDESRNIHHYCAVRSVFYRDKGELECTRDKAHSGLHVAHTYGENIAIGYWSQDGTVHVFLNGFSDDGFSDD